MVQAELDAKTPEDKAVKQVNKAYYDAISLALFLFCVKHQHLLPADASNKLSAFASGALLASAWLGVQALFTLTVYQLKQRL